MSEGRLEVIVVNDGFAIGWVFEDDDDDTGLHLGPGCVTHIDPSTAKVSKAIEAMRLGSAVRVVGGEWVFHSERKAKEVLKQVKHGLKGQWPKWAQKALAEGWKPPKGWKP